MTNSDDLYGMELDRRLTAERALTAVVEVVEAYESCGPKQQSTRDVLAAVRAAFEGAVLHGLDNCSQAPARALRDAARFFEVEMSRAWGGDAQWLTTGKRVAGVVADVLREEAADLDADRVAGVRRELSEEPCPACGGSMRFCECMDDSFAAVPRPLGPDGFTPLVSESVENARKAEQAERRAEEAEYHIEQLREARDSAERRAERIEARAVELATERDAALVRIARAERLIDSWEHDAPDHSNPVFIGRLRECLRRDPVPIRLRGDECNHQWLDRPESDSRECLICGTEADG